jgi:hypothetical protein
MGLSNGRFREASGFVSFGRKNAAVNRHAATPLGPAGGRSTKSGHQGRRQLAAMVRALLRSSSPETRNPPFSGGSTLSAWLFDRRSGPASNRIHHHDETSSIRRSTLPGTGRLAGRQPLHMHPLFSTFAARKVKRWPFRNQLHADRSVHALRHRPAQRLPQPSGP